MTNNRVYSTWSKEMKLGQIYNEYNEDAKMLDLAYDAVNNFCRKEQKKTKSYKTKKICWQ